MDNHKLQERVEYLEVTCQQLMATMKLKSPSPTPTSVCLCGESLNIENIHIGPSEFLAPILVGCAPALRKLPCKDLIDVFADWITRNHL